MSVSLSVCVCVRVFLSLQLSSRLAYRVIVVQALRDHSGVLHLTIIGSLYSCNESSSVRISPNASGRIHVAASLLMFSFCIISVQVPWGFSLSKRPHQLSVCW